MEEYQANYQSFVLVPEEWLKEITENLRILVSRSDPNGTEAGNKGLLQEWISEGDAKELLGRKTTWFWNKRKTGELPYTRVGRKVYYALADIKLMLEHNKC